MAENQSPTRHKRLLLLALLSALVVGGLRLALAPSAGDSPAVASPAHADTAELWLVIDRAEPSSPKGSPLAPEKPRQDIDIVPRFPVAAVDTAEVPRAATSLAGVVSPSAPATANLSSAPTASAHTSEPREPALHDAPAEPKQPLQFDAPDERRPVSSGASVQGQGAQPGAPMLRPKRSEPFKLPAVAGRSAFEGRWEGAFTGVVSGRLAVNVAADGSFEAQIALPSQTSSYTATGRVRADGKPVLDAGQLLGPLGRFDLQGWFDDAIDHAEGRWAIEAGHPVGAWRLDRTR